jgi:hypothetical protein
MGARISVPIVLGTWTAWAFVWFCVVIVVYSMRFQARVREFVKRFPKGGDNHAAAVAHLRSVAADKQSQAAGVAARLLRQVEQTPASLKPHPKSPRERGG